MSTLKAYDDGIYLLDSEYIQDEVAAIYLIVEKDEVAIIETATSKSVPLILDALNELGLEADNVKLIIPTHIHLDHAGGCGALLNVCNNATIHVHPRGLRHLIDPSKLIAGATAVYGEKAFNDLYGTIQPIETNRIKDQDDQTSIFLGDRELHFIHTEGHAKHHFCVLDNQSNSLFTGDTFGLSYPKLNALSLVNTNNIVIPTTTPIQFDPNALKKSLARIMSLNPKALYLTHFGPVDDNQSAYCQLLFWVSFYDGLVHNALKDNCCTEEYLYQELLKTTQNIYSASHELSAENIEHALTYDLRLNAQGLYHYSTTL